jgi:two-component system, OmpR family, sensor histidine kinase MtrB
MSGGDAGDGFGRRLSFIAHELLNPLAVAQGYAGLLKDEASTADEAVRMFAERVSHNVEVAVLLLQQLRDSAGDVGDLRLERHLLELGTLVRGTVEDLATTVAADHPVEILTPDAAVMMEADATRLRQILFNLISNGVKYSPAGSPIQVTVAAEDEATIEVRNHGFGVAPDDAERLFEEGARGALDTDRPGLGVGLYVSRRIAEAHGGSLTVEPAEVEGSRFILTLPVLAA